MSKDEVRNSVSEFYTKAVKAGTGCCGPASSCCGARAGGEAVVPKGFAAQFAGYGGDTAGLPADAVENSFGCGNPLAFSEVQPGQVVLDLGSGAGIDLLIAARKVGPTGRVIGVDMTDEMIARARANVAAAGLANVEVRKGIIEDLPVESGSVDWVISNCVINLSPEKDRVFAEIARVLKPGGRMSVSDIVVQDVPDWVRRSMALYASCVAGAVSEDEYVAGLRRAGLSEVEVTERYPYDLEQVKAFIASEVPPDAAAGGCCGAAPDVDAVASEVASKVWSAKFKARKPGA
jgi:ubiquinone/menaquinone biosynthesis C-methylase UbiE